MVGELRQRCMLGRLCGVSGTQAALLSPSAVGLPLTLPQGNADGLRGWGSKPTGLNILTCTARTYVGWRDGGVTSISLHFFFFIPFQFQFDLKNPGGGMRRFKPYSERAQRMLRAEFSLQNVIRAVQYIVTSTEIRCAF